MTAAPRLDNGSDNAYQLITAILGPNEASATDLALAWEVESALDDLKTLQRSERTVLRSKSLDLVLQQIWGHPCHH